MITSTLNTLLADMRRKYLEAEARRNLRVEWIITSNILHGWITTLEELQTELQDREEDKHFENLG